MQGLLPDKKSLKGRGGQSGGTPTTIDLNSPKSLLEVSITQAEQVGKAVKAHLVEVLKNNSGKVKGCIIKFGNKNNPYTIRLMKAGCGKRKNAYYRVTKSKKGALNKEGIFSGKQAETHFDINPNTLVQEIINIINKHHEHYRR